MSSLANGEEIDYSGLLENIGREIAALRESHPQLVDFSAAQHVDLESLTISYGYRTHPAKHAGGWTSGVPNPDPEGIWFYIDFHDPNSTAQIHTQPVVQKGTIGDKEVMLLILEGDRTEGLSNNIWEILKRNGIAVKEW